jgi:hypothetical protein
MSDGNLVSIETQLVRKAAVDWMAPRRAHALSCETTREWRLFLRMAFHAGAVWTFKRARAESLAHPTLERAARAWVDADMGSYRGSDPLELTFQIWLRGYQYALSMIENDRRPLWPSTSSSYPPRKVK